MYVSVHEHDKHSTPEKLTQSFIVCDGESPVENPVKDDLIDLAVIPISPFQLTKKLTLFGPS
jgi:hypothetical protein